MKTQASLPDWFLFEVETKGHGNSDEKTVFLLTGFCCDSNDEAMTASRLFNRLGTERDECQPHYLQIIPRWH